MDMDANTRFLIKRMDMLEHRLLTEIKELQKETERFQSIKNKVVGIMIGASFVVSSLVQVIFHKIGG